MRDYLTEAWAEVNAIAPNDGVDSFPLDGVVVANWKNATNDGTYIGLRLCALAAVVAAFVFAAFGKWWCAPLGTILFVLDMVYGAHNQDYGSPPG